LLFYVVLQYKRAILVLITENSSVINIFLLYNARAYFDEPFIFFRDDRLFSEETMSERSPVITVDGPSGAGKGTICQLLAQHLGWHLLDSGAIYRV